MANVTDHPTANSAAACCAVCAATRGCQARLAAVRAELRASQESTRRLYCAQYLGVQVETCSFLHDLPCFAAAARGQPRGRWCALSWHARMRIVMCAWWCACSQAWTWNNHQPNAYCYAKRACSSPVRQQNHISGEPPSRESVPSVMNRRYTPIWGVRGPVL